ncbi:hypothetical protein KM043_018642 [Ampulex compressa]|nr:hypothetical protein KM043_018642 [Ampulex compressa]
MPRTAPDKILTRMECPEGVVHEDSFKDIYAKFFPHGNSSLYAHYVFKAFDVNCNGAISFRDLLVTLSTLLRGSIYEKLRWTFKLYDINGDGCITKGELGEVVTAVHELMGRRHHAEEDRKAREQLDRVFKKLDLNQDGVITIEEFIESCLKDDVITSSLSIRDAADAALDDDILSVPVALAAAAILLPAAADTAALALAAASRIHRSGSGALPAPGCPLVEPTGGSALLLRDEEEQQQEEEEA